MPEAAPPQTHDRILVKGARVHNLRSVDLEIPKRRLVVFTGVSGSGKSSLAFDTLFAEGQRRYVESLSVYARQFLGQLARPDCDELRGLSPTISIEQKSISHNPRSTVGTITEVYDHLRVLYAHVGVQHCPQCGAEAGRSDPARISATLTALEGRTRFQLLAPLVRNRKGEFRDLFTRLRRDGFTRVRVDGEMLRLDDVDKLKKTFRHSIDLVVDRLVAGPDMQARVAQSVETALRFGDGRLVVLWDSGPDAGQERLFSENAYCADCDAAFPDLTHQSFSFNSPLGMCPSCHGLGTAFAMAPAKVIPDESLSISGGCFEPLRRRNSRAERWNWRVLEAFCNANEIDRRSAFAELPDEHRRLLLDGAEQPSVLEIKGRKRPTKIRFEGVLPYLARVLKETESEAKRERLGAYLSEALCETCGGGRLRRESAAVRVGGRALPDVAQVSVAEATAHFDRLQLEGHDLAVGGDLLGEIRSRLHFLSDVGLGYLSLDRGGPTLSGGEAQRIRLARQIGSHLTGVLYVLDEPSIGLHQRDNDRLLATLGRLRDQGNSVVVVEHDRDTIESADWVVDFGPGAGELGGHVTFAGPPHALSSEAGNVTGDYLSGRRAIPVPDSRRKPVKKRRLRIEGARANNLASIDVDVPLGLFTCVTGVSGAGKSSLINGILYPAAANHLYKEIRDVGAHGRIRGLDLIDKVVRINQQPIGRTPRSNPATYTKVFDDIRKLFAALPEARMYGYRPGRFSFNVAGGRCETCSGAGVRRIEMMFLSDVFVRCEDCGGLRFNDATLRVRYRHRDIAQVLDTTFDDALEFFGAHPRIRRILQTVVDVGLGYLTLGQPSPTLSGGEAQRIKLSRELAKVATGDTLYVLDEPTTGLHFEDVRRLVDVIQRLVDAGNTVVVIEHNMEIIKTADHVIDLGPEGGAAGGHVVATGPPEVLATCSGHTAAYLARELGLEPRG